MQTCSCRRASVKPVSASRRRITMSISSCIWSAASTACAAVGKTAIRPSPSVLTTTPPVAGTRREIASTVSVTIWDASVLPSNSYSAVLPRRSAKTTARRWMADMRVGFALEVVQVGAQLVRPARVLELADRLGLDLADAFARDVELLAHFLQRVVGGHLDANAHAQHLGLARRQAVEDVLDHVAQAGVHRGLDRGEVVGVLDEVAQV